ncbi:MAG: VPS10 domain-containing protein [Chitinophagales bacterium]
MRKITFTIITLFFVLNTNAQKTYKAMINDMSINFYDVCAEAEAYFADKDITKKGSGWKGYMRWRNANEYKYFPDGDRSNVDPFFVEKAYKTFLNNTISTKSLYPNGWRELGPFRIDSITGHYAAGLGRVEDFYVDPNNSDRIYLGSRSGGFWKTTDGGANWQGGTTDFLFASGVNAIAVSPTNPDSILINLRNARNGNSHGIYRSTDGGNTFVESNFNPATVNQGGLGDNFKIYKIAYHPTIANLVFVGTSQGIYRSDDNLATWNRLYSNGEITQIDFHPTNPNIVYIYDDYYWGANQNFVLSSVNAGVSYSQSNQIIGNNDASGRLSVGTDCPDCLFFASNEGVWKSTDNGINFSFLSNPSEGCGGFAVKDTDNSKMIYGYVDIDASSDGGFTFNDATRWSLGNTNGSGNGHQTSFETSTNYVHADLRNAKSINGDFYVSTDGFLCKSENDGANWEIISQGTPIRENYKLGASQSNHYRTVCGSQDNGTSIKHKDHWIEFYGADGMEALIHPLNDDYIISSLQYGGRRRTFNGGETQSGVSPSGQSGSGNADWEAPILYDPNNQMRIYNFSDSIFVSEEFGSNWVYRGAPANFSGTIDEAAIAENNSDIIVISDGDDIEKSIDGGTTFTSIKNNLPNYNIQDIGFDPNNDDVMIVVYARHQDDNSKVYLTTDGGNNWTNITHNLGNMPIHTVVIDHTEASNIYLGAEIGVYTKAMNDNTWVLHNPNLPNMAVEELEIVYGSNTLKAATWGRGLWEYSLVGRNNYPTILTTRINDMPTLNAPKVTRNQFVTSTISYDNNLTSVYVEWSANAPTFGNQITMSNVSDSTWVSDLPLPDQTIGTKMYFKVFAVGSNNDTSETYKFQYTLYPFEYCTSSGSTQYDGNVTLVNFNTINNATGKTLPYHDYTNTDSTEVFRGNNYDLSINLNTDNGNYEYFSKVWIDWNKDADFDDANEEYELGSTTNNSDGITSLSPLNITVPFDAEIGKTRMRVSCRYNGYPDACNNGYDGEVEDYSIIIKESPITYTIEENKLCLGNMLHFSYTGNTASNVSWSFSNGATSYTSTNETDSLAMNAAGLYNVVINATIGGTNFSNSENSAFLVQENINPSITATDNLLSVVPKGLNYTWLICDNNFETITGANADTYLATENGNYAVRATDDVCIDTSNCYQIKGISIIENSFSEEINLFPNPTKGNLNINMGAVQKELNLTLYNNLGQKIWKTNQNNIQEIEVIFPDIVKGIYYLHIHSNNEKAIFKLLKE